MSTQLPDKIIIASRESALALAQSEMIAAQLRALHKELHVSILGMTTRGDQILDRPLAQIGGKGLFIKELEVALLEGRADIAVHSMKDMPMKLEPEFALLTVGVREDARDAFVSNKYASLAALPAGAVVGTSSLRRESQLRIRFPLLKIASLRGNVNTRLRKLDEGEYDAIILAAAGLKRLGFEARIRARLSFDDSLTAVGQGALGIEYLASRADIAQCLAPFANTEMTACVAAERSFGAALQGSCDVPLAAHATIDGDELTLHGFIGLPDGSKHVRVAGQGSINDAVKIGADLAAKLLAQGGDAILAALQAR